VDTRTTNVLSICSGYGGIELGLRSVINSVTVSYLENEASACAILASRIRDGSLDDAPIWTDLRTFDPEPWRGKVDILAGGFPCQPHSVAGNKLGEDDPRELSGEVIRIADGLGLPDLFLENVPGIMRFYYENIRPRLQGMGYTTQEGLFTAEETGAPHRRQRLFILAHAAEQGLQAGEPSSLGGSPTAQSQRRDQPTTKSMHSYPQELAHTGVEGLEGIRPTWKAEYQERPEDVPLYPPGPSDNEGWAWLLDRWPELAPTVCKESPLQYEMSQIECQFCGSPDGPTQELPTEVLLRGIGNGVVPAVAALAFRELSKALNQTLQSV